MSELHPRPSATSLQWVLPTDRREHKTPNSLGPAHGLSLPQTALVAEPLLSGVTNRAVPASPFTEHGAQHNPHQSSWSVPFTAVCLGTWDSCLKTALNCLQTTHTESFSPNNEAEWGNCSVRGCLRLCRHWGLYQARAASTQVCSRTPSQNSSPCATFTGKQNSPQRAKAL